MRTTLTLDDDVAAQLERLGRQRDLKFRELVNEVLRRGLRDMSEEPRRRKAVRTRTFDMGKPLINIDNVAETLGHLESEGFK
jgi:adenine C2-methylase RlmN of 23S rRNA A2503 and tRNA A37